MGSLYLFGGDFRQTLPVIPHGRGGIYQTLERCGNALPA
jgi:hypothetical protein